jgi:predicted RecA/RadA family phage recombinase
MAKNFIQPGDTVTVPAPADVSSGDGVLVGSLFGVAQFDAKSGDDVEICTKGVYTLPKTSAQAWTVGAKIYWDGSKCTTADGSGSNTLIGNALAVAANPSATGVVRLSI